MAAGAGVESETCGTCCSKLKDLIRGYERKLGLDGNSTDGTKCHIFGPLNFCLEHNKFTEHINSIRSKCLQCKSWPDGKREKAIKASLERHQQAQNLAPMKVFIKECLDKLQHAMRDNSIKGVVQRLEAITRNVGLKFYDNGNGTDCFISSDMFYVEVKMETNGKVSEVKVAHAGDPESCPELTRVLREGDYEEFACHLKGLSDLYELSGDTFQKSKILMALKAAEVDLNMISALSGPCDTSTDTILQCPVGFATPRQGGRLMRLTYFASPYDLLDRNNPGKNLEFSKDNFPPLDLGCWVSVSVEQSKKCLLPTMPLVEEPMMSGMLDEHLMSVKYQPLNDNNSDELPASFVLQLNKPMPVAVESVQKIYSAIHETGNFVHSSKVPIHSLVIREWLQSKGIEEGDNIDTFYAVIPNHYHTYYLNNCDPQEVTNVSRNGVLIHRVPFTHPRHVPVIIKQLRRQVTYNTLLTSALRTHKPPPTIEGKSEHTFELSTSGTFTVTITFAHPCSVGMASIDFAVGEDSSILAFLHTVPGQPVFCSNDYISRVMQRCLSIPATMRCLIRKAESFKPEELPVKTTEPAVLTPALTSATQPSVKLDRLSIPGNPFFTPSGPTTPGFFTASPTFASLALETPSPTLGAFPFSISPTMSSFTFTGSEMGAMNLESGSIKQPEKKLDTPKPPSTPKLTLTLKRKRADEYVVKDFQMPDDVPKPEKKSPEHPTTQPSSVGVVSESQMDVDGPGMIDEGMMEGMASNFDSSFMLGPGFADVSGSDSRTTMNIVSSMASMASTSGLGRGGDSGGDLFELSTGGTDGGDLEGILQSLPGASHLPPGIVSVGGGLDFDAGLGPGVHNIDVDPNFDIDAAIDADTSNDPSIAGVVASAGAFDVDSALDFDLDHITGTPGDLSVTSAGDHGTGLPEGLLSPEDAMGMDTGLGAHGD
ncbi:mediator of RNA polymerase II transcription subunit 1 [Nematostella vectensis]|uniref:mediator of RNA polymerase II transcription subunit 1 n=1 Tax=Nematostella vectensis TaxID=45351 RepID=UPI0020771BD5|nr:mediator of RNA polymerase II transcription subunit 1 [Nematostella vectensis]